MSGKVMLFQTGAVQEVDYVEGMTVKQALAEKGWEVEEGIEILLNGAKCSDLDTVLKAGDMVTYVGEIAGGSRG